MKQRLTLISILAALVLLCSLLAGQVTIQNSAGKTTTYNGTVTVGAGQSVPIGQDDKIAQSANIAAVTLCPAGSCATGHYRVCYSTGVTATDASGATYVLTVGWTQSTIARTLATSSIAVAATANQANNCVPIFADAASNVTYSTTVTGTPTTGRYETHVWLVEE